MAKHHKTIINLIKNEEEELNERFENWSSLEEHYKNGEDLTEQEYLDILSGNHAGLSSSWLDNYSGNRRDYENMEDMPRVGDLLNRSKHNNPRTNEKILKIALEERNKAKNTKKDDDSWGTPLDDWEEKWSDGLKHLSKRSNLSSNGIEMFMDDSLLDPQGRDNKILKNPNLEKKHLIKFGQTNPSQIYHMYEHPSMDNSVLKELFNSESFLEGLNTNNIDNIVVKNMKGYNGRGDAIPDQDQELGLDPNITHAILDKLGDRVSKNSLNILLDHVDPTFKKQWTDEKMGITDGSYGHTFPEDYEDGVNDSDFQEENWGNWSNISDNSKYDERIADYLAGSRHIDDDQAEHIKRHGDIDSKYKLYENKHVDPRHGVEMFQKWYDDHDHHGYDAQELNEYHKQWKDDLYTKDDLDPSVLEEIQQEGYDNGQIDEDADERYSITEYFDDEEDSIVQKIIDGKHYGDNVLELTDEKVRDNWDRDHHWMGENPNSVQNEGNPEFDALNKLLEHEDDGHLSIEDLKTETGLKNWSELGIEADSDGDVHSSEIKDKLDEYGGPLQINYADNEDVHISEHPEYDERFEQMLEDAVREDFRNNPWEYSDSMYLYEDHRDSDGYQEALSEATNSYIEDNAKEYMDELWEGSHQDTRFIPHHLHAHIPNFEQLHAEQRTRNLDGPNRQFLNEKIKDRSYEHAYGEGQHHHELLKDYADANGGKIDVGTMNKLFPNQKDTWKKIFDGKGKLQSEEIQSKIDAIPKTNYDISFGKWAKNQMQNLNNQDQVIMRLDHSPESIKPLMEDSSVYDTFNKVQETSQRSGHPTRKNTIAWARIDTTDPKHWMIDETQSDFGKTVQRYLKKEGADEKASHIDKINEHHKNWRETLVNAVLKEAKKHGVERVSTHSPESKHAHAAYGSDKIHSTYKKGYKQVPRSMGFRPVEHTELPLTDKGRDYFYKGDKNRLEDNNKHRDAHEYHQEMAGTYKRLANAGWGDKATEFSNQHIELMNKHREKANSAMPSQKVENKGFEDLDHKRFNRPENIVSAQKAIKETGAIEGHEHDHLLDQSPKYKDVNHQGHTFEITPKFLKKNMDDFLELYDNIEKGLQDDVFGAIKTGVAALGLAHGAHYIAQESPKEKAASQFAQNAPSHARSVASVNKEPNEVQQAYDDAQKEANDIIARNDKKWFMSKHKDNLSPHVYKQTIKNNSDLNDKYGYVNKLSNSTFKEVIEKNPHLKNDVHSAHYDKLHSEFGGDYEKMSHAWSNGIKATYNKFNSGRNIASESTPKMDEQPHQDIVDDSVNAAPEKPNFTHRRNRGMR